MSKDNEELIGRRALVGGLGVAAVGLAVTSTPASAHATNSDKYRKYKQLAAPNLHI